VTTHEQHRREASFVRLSRFESVSSKLDRSLIDNRSDLDCRGTARATPQASDTTVPSAPDCARTNGFVDGVVHVVALSETRACFVAVLAL
jgi:hypothetical protein